MAEEIIKLSATPEITEPDGRSSRRNSTGKQSSPINRKNILSRYHGASISSCHDGGNWRSNSTVNPSSPNGGENIPPHYLRASSGSCHDFCKYGREHAFEEKARRPTPKRTTIPPSDKQNNMGTVVPAEWKKIAVVKLKPSLDSKAHSPNPPEIIKQEIFLPSKKIVVSSNKDSSNNRKMTKKEVKMTLSAKRSPSGKPKPVMVKPSSSYDASVGVKPKPVMVKSSSSYDNASVCVKPKSLMVKPSYSSDASVGVKPKPVIVKPSSSSNASVGLHCKRNSEIKLGKKMETSKAAVKKVLVPPTASLSPKPSVSRVVSLNARKFRTLKVGSPLKDQNRIRKAEHKQPNNDKVREKTLPVVEAETEIKILEYVQSGGIIQSPPSSLLRSPKSSSQPDSPSLSSHGEELEESEYTDSEADDFVSEDDEIVDINEVETSKGNHNMTPRKVRPILSEDKDHVSVKLKFRRGKVVDLQSENNGPRRLRFRRGRVLGDNEDSKGDARRRRFTKRGVDNDTNGTDPSSEKVALRHQDVQGKKDAQGLFNNVIEETASKLVESRKSKVKALVGAFETVISLQDNKPSTTQMVA